MLYHEFFLLIFYITISIDLVSFAFLLIFILVYFVYLNFILRKGPWVSLNCRKGVAGIKEVKNKIPRQESANFL